MQLLLYPLNASNDTFAAWKSCQVNFKKTWTNKLKLRKTLYSTTLKECNSVQQHLQKLMKTDGCQNKSSLGYSSKSYTKQALCLFNRPGHIHDPFGKNSGHVSISSEGVCEAWPHWCCAGLSKATFHHYIQSRPWVFPTLGVSKARLSMLYTYTLQAY